MECELWTHFDQQKLCKEPAVVRVVIKNRDGRVVDSRVFCEAHRGRQSYAPKGYTVHHTPLELTLEGTA